MPTKKKTKKESGKAKTTKPSKKEKENEQPKTKGKTKKTSKKMDEKMRAMRLARKEKKGHKEREEEEALKGEDLQKSFELLKPQEEMFVQFMMRGQTQLASYMAAFPSKSGLKKETLKIYASNLWAKPSIKYRYRMLMEAMQIREREVTEWTREGSKQQLIDLLNLNRQDLDRIVMAYEKESQVMHSTLAKATEVLVKMGNLDISMEDYRKQEDLVSKLTLQIYTKEKQLRVSGTLNSGIMGAIQELNKITGLYEDKAVNSVAINILGYDEIED